MDQLADRNVAGEREPYHHLPFFYSDLFEFSYEAVGELDSRLEIVTDLTEQNHLGSDTLPPTESARSRRALGTSGAVNAAWDGN